MNNKAKHFKLFLYPVINYVLIYILHLINSYASIYFKSDGVFIASVLYYILFGILLAQLGRISSDKKIIIQSIVQIVLTIILYQLIVFDLIKYPLDYHFINNSLILIGIYLYLIYKGIQRSRL
jgi:hypothetical protein